jgi:glutaredoxin 3
MNITIYTKPACPNCDSAKKLLDAKGLEYTAIDAVEHEPDWVLLVRAYPDARQMPQVFIDGQRVGGLAGLQAALKTIENSTPHMVASHHEQAPEGYRSPQ